jgi:hypothetical protein
MAVKQGGVGLEGNVSRDGATHYLLFLPLPLLSLFSLLCPIGPAVNEIFVCFRGYCCFFSPEHVPKHCILGLFGLVTWSSIMCLTYLLSGYELYL